MGIVETFSLLATAAEAMEEGGFGLNFDILETNLINLALVTGILVYFGRGLLGKVMADRRSEIETAIRDAEQRKEEAIAALADQQQKLAQAQTEASQIRATAEENAKSAREKILAQAEQDVQRLRESAAQDLSTQRERAILELRQRVAEMAIQNVESRLRGQLDSSTQQQLVDKSIALLGGRS